VQGGFGACFCRPGTNFIAYWRDRGTSLIGAANFSPVTNYGCGHWRSVAVQAVSELEISHGAGYELRADARVRVQEPLRNYLGAGAKQKL